jgi:hypothetical protein
MWGGGKECGVLAGDAELLQERRAWLQSDDELRWVETFQARARALQYEIVATCPTLSGRRVQMLS